MRAANVVRSMRVMSLLLALAGCGADAAPPAADDEGAPNDRGTPRSSCGAGDKCVTAPPPGDAGIDPGRAEPPHDASTPDAGAPDAAALICPLEDEDDVCATCLKFSCCDEVVACGPACQALVQCASACPSTSTTDACAQRCFDAHPDGVAAFVAFAGCVGVQCEAACAASE